MSETAYDDGDGTGSNGIDTGAASPEQILEEVTQASPEHLLLPTRVDRPHELRTPLPSDPNTRRPDGATEVEIYGSADGRYQIVGSLAVVPDLPKMYGDHMSDRRTSAIISGECEPTNTIRQMLPAAQEGVMRTGVNSGVPPEIIQHRLLLPVSYYRPFNTQKAYTGAVKQQSGTDPADEAVFLPHVGVMFMQDGDRVKEARRLTIGTIMAGAVQWIRPFVIPPEKREHPKAVELGFNVSTGYVRPDLTSEAGVNTMVTDMATHRSLQRMGMRRELIRPNNSVTAALGSAAVLEAANKHGMEPQSIENLLTEGYFTGNTDGVNAVCEALGPGGNSLLALTGRETPADIQGGIADVLGLGKWSDYISEVARNPLLLYDWR